ncbi:hypothetical protein BAE44_0024602, partial [Dichanthelium oligosanthes]
LIVCDPLTRQYQGIHHPPKKQAGHSAGVFLLDGDDGGISISNFRVMHRFRFYQGHGLQACVFSAADGGDWRFLEQSADDGEYESPSHVAGRVDGSLYVGLRTGNVMVLDNATLGFSKVDLPIQIDTWKLPYSYTSMFKVVHGASPDPTSPPSTWIIHVRGEELEFFRLVRGSGEWVLEHSIQLSEATRRLPGSPEKFVKWTLVDRCYRRQHWDGRLVNPGPWQEVVFLRRHRDAMEMQVVPNEAYSRTRTTFTYTLPWPQFLRACAP